MATIAESDHDSSSSSDPPIKKEEEEIFYVEQILDDRYNKSKKRKEYLIKWKKYPSSQNTWEPMSSMEDPRLVKLYLKEKSEKMQKRRSPRIKKVANKKVVKKKVVRGESNDSAVPTNERIMATPAASTSNDTSVANLNDTSRAISSTPLAAPMVDPMATLDIPVPDAPVASIASLVAAFMEIPNAFPSTPLAAPKVVPMATQDIPVVAPFASMAAPPVLTFKEIPIAPPVSVQNMVPVATPAVAENSLEPPPAIISSPDIKIEPEQNKLVIALTLDGKLHQFTQYFDRT